MDVLAQNYKRERGSFKAHTQGSSLPTAAVMAKVNGLPSRIYFLALLCGSITMMRAFPGYQLRLQEAYMQKQTPAAGEWSEDQ